MDNAGSVGGENLSGVPEGFNVAPDSFEQNFGPSEFEQRAEQKRFGAQAELGRETLGAMPFEEPPEMDAGAAELGYGDANAQITEIDGEMVGTDLTREVKRNNERLTKNTVKAVKKIGHKIEKAPHEGIIEFSLARKAYMKEAFNREIGARNDGSKVAGMNMIQGKVA